MKIYVVQYYTWIGGKPHGVGKRIRLSDDEAKGYLKGGLIKLEKAEAEPDDKKKRASRANADDSAPAANAPANTSPASKTAAAT